MYIYTYVESSQICLYILFVLIYFLFYTHLYTHMYTVEQHGTMMIAELCTGLWPLLFQVGHAHQAVAVDSFAFVNPQRF